MEGIDDFVIGENCVAYIYYNDKTHCYRAVAKKEGLGRAFKTNRSLTDYVTQNPHKRCFIFERGVYEMILDELGERFLWKLGRSEAP